MSVYYIFAIKCTKDNSFYLGVSTKKTANSLHYMLSAHEKDETKYVKLVEHVKKYGKQAFICSRLTKSYDKKEDAEWVVFNQLTKLQESGRVLNDSIINPTREECTHCGQRIRQDFMEKHLTTYCKTLMFKEIDVNELTF
jgi:hypothetical protein